MAINHCLYQIKVYWFKIHQLSSSYLGFHQFKIHQLRFILLRIYLYNLQKTGCFLKSQNTIFFKKKVGADRTG